MKPTCLFSRWARIVLAVLCGVAVFTGRADAQVLYVDANSTGGDGTTWATAFDSLHVALAQAAPGNEIWVADGTYMPPAGESFVLPNEIALYGGFSGTETNRSERRPDLNVVTLRGYADSLITNLDWDDYKKTVVVANDVTASIDGFTITEGYGTYDGGAIHATGSALMLSQMTLENNQASNGGGAAISLRNGSLHLVDSQIQRNIGYGTGGGLRLRDSDVVVSRVTFEQNEVRLYGSGGAIYTSGGTLAISKSAFIRNKAVSDYETIAGGAIDATSTHIIVVSSYFYGNSTYGIEFGASRGGAISARRLPKGSTVTGSAFVLNSSVATYAGNVLGGIIDGDSTLHVSNSTIVENTAFNTSIPYDFDIYTDGIISGETRLSNSIVWSHQGGSVAESVTVETSIVEGGAEGVGVFSANPLFIRLPSAGPDERWQTDDDDYGDLRLRVNSPAIDAGTADYLPIDAIDLDADQDTTELLPLDLAGEARQQGTSVDLGAYEAFGAPISSEGTPAGTLQLSLGPNPANHTATVFVQVTQPTPLRVSVHDMLGRHIETVFTGALSSTHTFALDTSAWPTGVYRIRASSPNATVSTSLVVAR